MREPVFQIEEVNDSVGVARCKAQDERGRRNSEWLQSHWADLLPQARGKFVAVAGRKRSSPARLRRHGPGPPRPIPKMIGP